MKNTPVGKAQQQVLDALGLEADSFFEADNLFASIRITVISKRIGRSSIPTIRYNDSIGYTNKYGEGETDHIDMTAIKSKLAHFETV